MTGGRLTVVGTGIKSGWHTTLEARRAIERADRLLFIVNDAVSTSWIRKLNPNSESLAEAYREGHARYDAYRQMVERILAGVRKGGETCAAFYGHPGVFVRPSREALHRARAEGFEARMLPGVSAEDCVFADLGLEPAATGVQRYEATDFLLYPRGFDPRSALILWQVGVIGQFEHRERGCGRHGLEVLGAQLGRTYGLEHEVVLYEAATSPLETPVVERMPLRRLAHAPATARSTLYVPPLPPEPPDPEMVRRLGLAERFGGIDARALRRVTGIAP